jgi:VIT1/CCC1 family predicted Fe2+/Mn2+ transporter
VHVTRKPQATAKPLKSAGQRNHSQPPVKRRASRRRSQKQRDAFQAAVLGVNDGLVSTLALLLGVAGAGSAAPAVRVAGFASLVAGACSLAVSQYIAGQTLAERQQRVALELKNVDALDADARGDLLEQELIGRGIGLGSAHIIGDALVADASKSSSVLGLLRYGFRANDRSSPLRSAFATLLSSGAGALVPIVPWFFFSGMPAIISSLLAACVVAVVIGALIGNASNGRWLPSALRQLGLVLLAATVTYEIGHLLRAIGAL